MKIEDIWTGVEDRSGHVAGAWDCLCGPWVLTDMDQGDEGIRTVRHLPCKSREDQRDRVQDW